MSRRILFWSERFWPTIGGVGLSSARLLPALQARGWEFVVVTLKENADLPEEDSFHGMRVCRWPFWTAVSSKDPFQMLSLRKRVAALKREFAPDLIHIDFLGSSVLFHEQTKDAHPAPVLVSTDSAFLEDAVGRDSLAGRTLLSADWVTCVSNFHLVAMREAMPEIVPRSSCVYKGRRSPDIKPGKPPASPRILCLGRLVQSKGFDLALSAFASISSRYPDSRLIIGGDGPDRPELEQQIKTLGMQARVDMLGWVDPDDVPELMNSATLILIPSRSEGLPNVAKEAGLMSRPVVATRVGGLPEVIDHGETGLIIDPGDASALSDSVTYLLDHADEAAEMGRRARTRVSRIFDFETYATAYENLYEMLTAEGRMGAI